MDAIELGQALGRIEATLVAHTQQDSDNFAKLNEKLDQLDWRPALKRVLKWGAAIAISAGVGGPAVQAIAQAIGWLP